MGVADGALEVVPFKEGDLYTQNPDRGRWVYHSGMFFQTGTRTSPSSTAKRPARESIVIVLFLQMINETLERSSRQEPESSMK